VPYLYIPPSPPAHVRGFGDLPLRSILRGMGDYTAVANLIQQTEGYYPGTLAYQNNNPGNLVYAGQAGATPAPPVVINGTTYVFAQFPTYQAGYQALLNQISLQASQGQTIQQFAAQYASSPGDNPTAYAQSIAAAVGLSPTDLLSSADTGSTADVAGSGFDLSSFGLPSIDLTDPATLLWLAVGVLGLAFVISEA